MHRFGRRILIPNVPCIIPPGISHPLLTSILLRARYEELQYKLENLSESDPGAKRKRDLLYKERKSIVSEIDSIFPVFRIPSSVRLAITKCTRKFFISNPNMIGFILGPRGSSLREMEKELDVRISIRGKGSTLNARNFSEPNRRTENEPLHALIESDSEAKIDQCIKRLEDLTTPVPDSENERKKEQLRRLAVLNGVSGVDDGKIRPPWCDNSLSDSGVISELDQAFKEDTQPPAGPVFSRFLIDLNTVDISTLILDPSPLD